jgi:hypothetical protein
MTVLPSVADAVTRRLPRILSPTGHAVADYVTIGIFAIAGSLFWRRNKRAALAAFLCGGAELALCLLTDYPGGTNKVFTFPAHGKMDVGLAAVTATMPELLSFREGRGFFLVQAGVLTAKTNLTKCSRVRNNSARRHPTAV